MRIIGTGFSILVLMLAVSSCDPPSRETTNDPGVDNEPAQQERFSEPQVRDGIPEEELQDSIAIDTAGTDTTQPETL